jgi:DNA repair protein RadA/Sms
VARDAAAFECTACGQPSGKWMGRCPACGGWNTLEAVPDRRPLAARADAAAPTPITAAELHEPPRWPSGMPGLDRVLGGGLVAGSVVLLAGEPGVGKSTLLLQVAALCAATDPVLYVSAEESNRQVALRAARLGCLHDGIVLLAEPEVESAVAAARRLRPRLVIADSVQTMVSDRVPAVAGSVTQVREVAAQLVALAKRDGPTVVLVGHVTKDGTIAGPKSLEHLVDVLLEFSGAAALPYRGVRATKNRFGPAMELALFRMSDTGLQEVANPSAALLSDRRLGAPGSAVAAVIEGTTPLLVEVQALVSRSTLVNPRRIAQGVDPGRLALLIAVLERRAGLRLADRDVFVNIVGGVAVDEPALDLAVAAAIVSAAHDVALPADLVLLGEIGLLGEVRGVGRTEERLREAAALGFARCALAEGAAGLPAPPVSLVTVPRVADLVRLLLEEPAGEG